VRLSAAFDCLTPATTGTSRDPKTPGECHLYLAEGCHLYIALTEKSRISGLMENDGSLGSLNLRTRKASRYTNAVGRVSYVKTHQNSV
jgi:hypothetical protein